MSAKENPGRKKKFKITVEQSVEQTLQQARNMYFQTARYFALMHLLSSSVCKNKSWSNLSWVANSRILTGM